MRAGARKGRQRGTGEADRERQITEEWKRAFEVEVEGSDRASERAKRKEGDRGGEIEELLLGCHLQSKIPYDISSGVVTEAGRSFI